MRSSNQGNVVDVIEFGGNFGAKQPTGSSWRHSPGFDVLRVRPHKVAEWTFMRDFHSSVDKSDLVDGLDFRRESSMDTEDFAFNYGTNAEVVKDFGAVFPWVCISIFSNCLIIEAIYGGDLSSLVVTSKECNMSWILELEAKKELECFNRVEASIDKVTHEDISSVWDFSTFVK